MSDFYQFSANLASSETIDFSIYKDKIVLVVNTASQCGFTPQYKGLEALYQTYHPQGFELLAFPCNQFGQQEPGSNTEILSFCETTFHTTFSIFAKIDVKGKNAHPLFKWLTKEAPGILGTKVIKWNFTKFLINQHGQVVQRFGPQTAPETIKKYIDDHLIKST